MVALDHDNDSSDVRVFNSIKTERFTVWVGSRDVTLLHIAAICCFQFPACFGKKILAFRHVLHSFLDGSAGNTFYKTQT